jgi:hypothetical protein
MRLRIIAFASIVVAAMGVASLTTPAQAQAGGKDRHCVTNVSVPNAPTTCYDSFTTAIAKATEGRITDAPENARKAANDPRLQTQLNATGAKKNGLGTAAVSPVTILYRDADFGGGSWILTGDHDCTGPTDNRDYWMDYVGDSWNDDIGSYKAYRNCWLMLFEDIGYGGASIPFAGTRTDLGILDDAVSSIIWS